MHNAGYSYRGIEVSGMRHHSETPKGVKKLSHTRYIVSHKATGLVPQAGTTYASYRTFRYMYIASHERELCLMRYRKLIHYTDTQWTPKNENRRKAELTRL